MADKPDRFVQAHYPALWLWWQEVNAGLGGQDPSQPSTWKKDALWRAAAWEMGARETHPEDVNNPSPAWKTAMQNAAQIILEAGDELARGVA